MKYATFIGIVLALALIAAKPWRTVNKTLGVRQPDSLSTAYQNDSMMVTTPIQVVLPASQVDTLRMTLVLQDSVMAVLRDSLKRQVYEIAKLERSIKAKQSKIVTLEEVDELLKRQQLRAENKRTMQGDDVSASGRQASGRDTKNP